MDIDNIVLLVAAAWAVLSFLARGVAKQRGGQREDAEPVAGPEPEVRRRQRLERLRARRMEGQARAAPKPAQPSPREAAVADLREELERIMGVRPEAEYGPLGRRSGVRLEGAEEVEERDTLEEEPDVVTLEGPTLFGDREIIDQDDAAEAPIQHRLDVAEARLRPRTKADHTAFDQRIRTPSPVPVPPAQPARRRGARSGSSLRAAMIWSEVLSPPVALRPRGDTRP